ncbi:MAG: hypothetical protein NVS9B2_12180 [Steroidobacteraceae bacterium]
MMNTKSTGYLAGLLLVSAPVIAALGAEGSNDGNALPALHGYSVKVWAKGTSAYKNPDSIDTDRGHVWVGYQNKTSKTGGDGKSSTVVEYDSDGHALRTFAVPGHCDGLRIDPATHTVWASSNEDGNPGLVSIDPASGKVTSYSFDPTAHGGGFDDMAFLNGKMFIAASNPNLDSNGVNVFPAVDEVSFNGTKVVLTPVLLGNAMAVDTMSGQPVTLNEVDPDSLSIDASGNLVLVNQGGSEIVYIANPGTASQTVSRTLVGTQLEDTVWIKSAARGRLLVVDGKTNTIYSVKTDFTPGTIYTQTPDDSGVSSFVGTLDPATGIVKPIIIGFVKATGLIFDPTTGDED